MEQELRQKKNGKKLVNDTFDFLVKELGKDEINFYPSTITTFQGTLIYVPMRKHVDTLKRAILHIEWLDDIIDRGLKLNKRS